MECELLRLNAVLFAGLGDEALRERRALVRGEHPADDVAAEDVEDHVEIGSPVSRSMRRRPGSATSPSRAGASPIMTAGSWAAPQSAATLARDLGRRADPGVEIAGRRAHL